MTPTDTASPSSFLELRALRVERTSDARALFEVRAWSAPEHAITVLLGPAGVGKSTLLRWLATGTAPAGLEVTGALAVEADEDPRRARERLCLVPQRTARSPDATATMQRVHAALEAPRPRALLDEVDRWMTPHERNALRGLLSLARTRGAVLLVTHDLAFAREVADYAALLTPEGLAPVEPVERFFLHPSNALAARFLAQGSAWPGGPVGPRLPSHFHWILPKQLAGMGRPGLLGDEDDDLAAIALEGVTLLVSLTEQAVAPARLRAVGVEGRHFPIVDMGVPAINAMARLCRDVERVLAQGGSAAFHCHAGVGRTGLALASYLVWKGTDPEAAIARVREEIPRAVETAGQERFVRSFAAHV